MDRHGLSVLLRSWGRVDEARIHKAVHPFGIASGDISPYDLGCVVASLYGLSLGLDNECARDLGHMSLEAHTPGEDPLGPTQAALFCGLLESTVSFHSTNGYLNYGEALGRALRRSRVSRTTILVSASLHVYGEGIVGVIKARDEEGREHDFCFTDKGVPISRDGMCRSCEMPIAALRGLGYVLDSDSVLASERDEERAALSALPLVSVRRRKVRKS